MSIRVSSKHADIPFWPRGLREPLAAAYVGLSETTFRLEVAAGRVPRPVRLTEKRQVWLRDQLDAWLERKAGLTAPATIQEERAMIDRELGL